MSFDSLAILSLMLSVGFLLDQLTLGSDQLRQGNLLGWLVIFSVFLLWLRPKSIIILSLLLIIQNVYIFNRMPIVPNHVLVEFFVNFGLLLIIGLILIGQPLLYQDDLRRKIYNDYAPLGRLLVIVLYFFSVFHKLNYDFFSQEHGCAVGVFLAIYNRFPLPQAPNFLILSLGWLTIITESTIPIFLCFRSTRFLGIGLGGFFHFILALHPAQAITGFSAMLYSHFFLFMFPAFIKVSANKLLLNKINKIKIYLIVLMLFLVFSVVFIPHISKYSIQTFFVLWSCLLMIAFVLVIKDFPSKITDKQISNKNYFLGFPIIMWIIPLILFINSITSYLGLKTHTNLSMFSNLQTENNKSNHFFIKQNFKIAGFQDDLAKIINTDVGHLKRFRDNKQIMITYFEFKRIVSKQKKDFFVDYVRNGKRHYLKVENGIANYPDVIKPNHWLLNKLLSFRPVHSNHSPCDW